MYNKKILQIQEIRYVRNGNDWTSLWVGCIVLKQKVAAAEKLLLDSLCSLFSKLCSHYGLLHMYSMAFLLEYMLLCYLGKIAGEKSVNGEPTVAWNRSRFF